MKPTNNLRFVKRAIPIHGEPHDPNGSVGRIVMILQQWHESDCFDMITDAYLGKWLDVPTGEE